MYNDDIIWPQINPGEYFSKYGTIFLGPNLRMKKGIINWEVTYMNEADANNCRKSNANFTGKDRVVRILVNSLN